MMFIRLIIGIRRLSRTHARTQSINQSINQSFTFSPNPPASCHSAVRHKPTQLDVYLTREQTDEKHFTIITHDLLEGFLCSDTFCSSPPSKHSEHPSRRKIRQTFAYSIVHLFAHSLPSFLPSFLTSSFCRANRV
eukprot:GHVU01052736.1.p1 GENE.GHVU01052736.1~~GHVU01052736.1.p1  ORF type:complete len:135 (-),score=6.46 GHVU01052736.1:35-439(-)